MTFEMPEHAGQRFQNGILVGRMKSQPNNARRGMNRVTKNVAKICIEGNKNALFMHCERTNL